MTRRQDKAVVVAAKKDANTAAVHAVVVVVIVKNKFVVYTSYIYITNHVMGSLLFCHLRLVGTLL
jgi:hypothetical protein